MLLITDRKGAGEEAGFAVPMRRLSVDSAKL
jgi:hypothetical protein